MKKKVICDTNIWYNIANKSIPIEKLNSVHLVGTAITIHEFSSTPNMLDNMNLVKDSIKAFLTYCDSFILANPFEYILSLYDLSFIPETKTEIVRLKVFEKAASVDPDSILENNINKARLEIYDIRKGINEATKIINMKKPEIIGRIKSIGKSTYRKYDHSKRVKDQIIKMIEEYTKKYKNEIISIPEDHKVWDSLTLVLQTFERYLLDLEVSKKKSEANDWNDLMNMCYVNNNDLYWTQDNYWKKMVNENISTRYFLYKPIYEV